MNKVYLLKKKIKHNPTESSGINIKNAFNWMFRQLIVHGDKIIF